MAKQAKTVVRGAGGRFQAGEKVVTKQSLLEHEQIDPLDLDDDEKPSAPRAESLVAQVIRNSRSLFNAALDLQETLHSVGVLEQNQLNNLLGNDDVSDSDEDSVVDDESEMHLVQLIERHIAKRQEDVLCASAGKVMTFHAMPALALATYVATHLTDVERSSLFDYLNRAREESHSTVYQFALELRNRLMEGLIAQEGVLISEDIEQSTPMVSLAQCPLVSYIVAVNDVLVETTEGVERMTHNIKQTLM